MALSNMRIKELLDENRAHDCEGLGKDKVCVRIAAIADLPSRFDFSLPLPIITCYIISHP